MLRAGLVRGRRCPSARCCRQLERSGRTSAAARWNRDDGAPSEGEGDGAVSRAGVTSESTVTSGSSNGPALSASLWQGPWGSWGLSTVPEPMASGVGSSGSAAAAAFLPIGMSSDIRRTRAIVTGTLTASPITRTTPENADSVSGLSAMSRSKSRGVKPLGPAAEPLLERTASTSTSRSER